MRIFYRLCFLFQNRLKRIDQKICLVFFLVIYNPDSKSRYHESFGTLTACLPAYSHSYKSYSTSHNYGANSDVSILGDFNLPGINW